MSELTIHRGAADEISTIVVPASLVTDSVIYFMAKRSIADADEDAILSYTSEVDGRITVVSSVTGEIRTIVDPADTRTLANIRTLLRYEIEIEKAGVTYFIEDGTLLVRPELIQRALP